MSVIPMLLLVGLLLAGGFLACFWWAVRSGQFDDTYTPSLRVLTEDLGDSQTNIDVDEQEDSHVTRGDGNA